MSIRIWNNSDASMLCHICRSCPCLRTLNLEMTSNIEVSNTEFGTILLDVLRINIIQLPVCSNGSKVSKKRMLPGAIIQTIHTCTTMVKQDI